MRQQSDPLSKCLKWYSTHSKPRPRFVAIKILTAYHSHITIVDNKRFEYQALLSCVRSDDHLGKGYCTLIQDAFPYFESKHGSHLCMVFNAYSINLHQYMYHLRRTHQEDMSLRGIKNVVKQVLMAASYVHSMKLAHTDIKLDNLFIDTGIRDDEIETILRTNPSRTYPPRYEPRISAEPIVTVESQPLPLFGNPVPDNLSIKLGDFGGARFMKEGGIEGVWVMPDGLRAPEIFLGVPWGTPIDIWSIGCLVWSIIFFHSGRKIFDANFPRPQGMSLMHAHLARIEELLDPIPPSFIERCPERDSYFDSEGHLLHKLSEAAQPLGSLGDQLCQSTLKGKCSPGELLEVERFMRRCLAIDPDERPTAEVLLKDSWLQDVD